MPQSVPSPNQLLDFTNQTVLVTGAGSGLGSAIAVRFAQAGARTIVHYHRSADSAQNLVAQIKQQGGEAIAMQADVTQEQAVSSLFAEAVDAFGRLDILINNAGIYPLSPLLEMATDEWDSVINANLRSTFLCTQAAARQMMVQGSGDTIVGGAIVNIASIEGEQPAPMHSHYSAAKAGVLMHTRAAAQELGPYNIRVNAVAPGLIWREGIEEAWADGVQRWRDAAPLTRLGQPDDVADACLFLASPAARWITGATLRVDGGVMSSPIF